MTETITEVPTYTDEEIREHRIEFLAALRSGEFEQGRGKLCTKGSDGTERRCCLGVVETLAGTPFTFEHTVASFEDATTLGGNPNTLTPRGMAWLGVLSSDPLIDRRTATAWNDSVGLTFPQIADKFAYEWGME